EREDITEREMEQRKGKRGKRMLTHHVCYHHCLKHLDKLIGYVFKERCLIQARHTNAHTLSLINHNERLEFLGDAIVGFLTSVHLYYRFPCLEEGGLATYRTAIVQNQHLVMLAKKLELDRFMFHVHRPDLYRESDLRPAMATCFEALIGECGGVEEPKQLFGRLLFNGEVQEPQMDRQLIEMSPVIQKLTDFEDAIGVMFTHCRLLAKSFTPRTVGFNHLTLREFLGDSIMQLMAAEYLFIHFHDHHEGHLTLLRSSLVNTRTQVKVEEELGMQEFAITNDKAKRLVALRTKTLADLLEFHTFVDVYFFPQLKENFILNHGAGQSHARTETVAVYFKEERIGCGKGPSIQQAVMEAAMDWLEKYKLFEEEQELKEMKRERERQQKVGDEPEESRK
uniref:Drosha ribonuclease III n=1 Tax=Oncorhynchus kisutch TaxID=8019 RepID=A0A8C7KM71_ONCKI